MKLNGVGKAGIICLLVNSTLVIIGTGGILLVPSFRLWKPSSTFDSTLTLLTFFSLVLPVLTIIFGILTLVKGKNHFKITTGVLGLLCIISILALVGGILTLCGKILNSETKTVQPVNLSN